AMGFLLLILLSYFLCLLSETALVNLSPHDQETLRTEESRTARRILALSQAIRPTLSALLLARIFLLVSAGIGLAAFLLHSADLSVWTAQVKISPAWFWGVVGTILGGLLGLIFWGLHHVSNRISRKMNNVWVLKRFWYWAVFWKTGFTPFTFSKNDTKKTGNHDLTTPPIETVSAASEKRELELLKSIVQFSDVTVKQVMQPRSKVVFVPFRTGFYDLLGIVKAAEFSRLPVCDEDLDNITGILYVKDLLPHLDKENDFEWQRIIRTNVLMVPEAKRGSELLQEFKQQRMHMAIVVDEYGGMAGIVTLEDILEEVTGDIRDEFDEESEIRYRKLDEYNYLFEGQTLLNDVCRMAGLANGVFDSIKGNADTLAGLALELRGDIPHAGTKITWNGYVLTIINANKRRIEQIKLTLPPTTPLSASNAG
ncbi:MAG: transporter associated domain-containing protein, partial [Saprospiraceae bacterium]|nr:transporter associated domain-containing protein [Saprospiraceae bacterium]